jgi:hypothetical protein
LVVCFEEVPRTRERVSNFESRKKIGINIEVGKDKRAIWNPRNEPTSSRRHLESTRVFDSSGIICPNKY